MSARTGGSFGGGTWGKVLEFKPRRPVSATDPARAPRSTNVPGRPNIPSVIDALRGKFHCLACDRSPDLVEVYRDAAGMRTGVEVSCHGSRQTVMVDEEAAYFRPRGEWVATFVDEISALFPHDSSPDMKELLRYNREGWR